MEKRHKARIQSLCGNLCRDKRMAVLGIVDDYTFMQPELVALLEQKVSRYLR